MAFVNEYLPDEDIEKFKLRDYHRKRWLLEYTSWTVDRERDIYLRRLGPWYVDHDEGASPEEYWALGWHKIPLIFRSIYSIKNNPETGAEDIYWTLTYMEWPDEFAGKHQEVLDILKEACAAYGYGGVHANEPPPKTVTLVIKID